MYPEELACAIVERAAKDWRLLIYKNQTSLTRCGERISFTELRRFFKSPYCKTLLLTLDPLILLEQLENELKEAREQGVFL